MSAGDPGNGNGYPRWRDIDAMTRRIDRIDDRVNTIEGVIDQQRGAKALVVFLIGSNLLAVVAVMYGLLR